MAEGIFNLQLRRFFSLTAAGVFLFSIPNFAEPSLTDSHSDFSIESSSITSESQTKVTPRLTAETLDDLADHTHLDSRITKGFPEFFLNFLSRLDERFVREFKSDQEAFLSAVEKNWFYANDEKRDIHIETKLISGQCVIRVSFAKKSAEPTDVIFVNTPILANRGLKPIQVSMPESIDVEEIKADPVIVDSHLDRYRSRDMVNRKVSFFWRDILKNKGFLGPAKAFAVIDLKGGEISDRSYTSALPSIWSARFQNHYRKIVIEKIQPYSDMFRGFTSASAQFGVALGLTKFGEYIHPRANPVIWSPAVMSWAFAFIIATNSDSYVNGVTRGDNEIWETTKRLVIASFLAYPVALAQANWNFDILTHLSLHATILLVGFGDRYVSTQLNNIPNFHNKYRQKPWFFPTKFKTPGQDLAADLLNSEEIRNEKEVKGVTYTREVLSIAKFGLKFAGLFLDPMLMQYTTVHIGGADIPIPVATLLFWLSGLPIEVMNRYFVKKIEAEHPDKPHMLADLRKIKEKGMLPKIGWLGRKSFSCIKAIGSLGSSMKNDYIYPY
ncbi:MAG: hypothetical protein J0L93_04450 [Deltaproteobacteria bacterium]|nr:hypothetical protein [Deltaproteobacteria bacterium]